MASDTTGNWSLIVIACATALPLVAVAIFNTNADRSLREGFVTACVADSTGPASDQRKCCEDRFDGLEARLGRGPTSYASTGPRNQCR